MNRIFIALLILSVACPAICQAPPPPDRDALVRKIQNRAVRDVDLGNSPQRIGELKTLFGAEAERLGVAPAELLQIYEEEYKRSKDALPLSKRVGKQIGAKAGWWISGLLLLLLIFRDVLKEGLTALLKALQDYVYGRLAGSRMFRRTALRRYRKTLVTKYENLTIPFRPDRPLEMRKVFVPLKVQGTRDIDQVDAQQAIVEHGRLMVTGPPGSGKSMFARHVALTLAEQGLYNRLAQPVPVLLELHRMNDSELSVEDQLIEAFHLSGFPRADGFVRQALEQGFLMLLFDGLDEVATQKRSSIVGKIKDLLATYNRCRALVTCRTAVYHREFAETADRTLEIVEFSDHQIWRFLAVWERDMPAGKSIEQLLQTLRDRPRIMALARNPLLLTIIAYLYTDTKFVLPHSRTEFYDRSTDLLLDQWKYERNHYKSNQKRLVLQHLALFNQKRGSEQHEDRRSIDLTTVLSEIGRVLPQLNLEGSEAQPVLDEIVERSGLLLSMDGDARYQFAHLSLQEFFAAAKLRTESQELLEHYQADPAAWRETVKLWCGLGSDSTGLIQAIFTIDPVTAFESLADAQMVDPSVADDIVGHFRERLAESGESGEAIRRAFAAVAADLRPRGQEVFDFLVSSFGEGKETVIQEAAADALSRTNLPRAADVLAKGYGTLDQARSALVRMGELAVRELVGLAEAGQIDAVDDLWEIGTPQVSLALIPFLWAADQDVATRAAWRLGDLLASDSVKSTLREMALTEDQRKAEWLDWIWEPFDEPDSALPVIVGRIGHLMILREPAEAEALNRLESRLGLALCVASMEFNIEVKGTPALGLDEYDPGRMDQSQALGDLTPVMDAVQARGSLRRLLSTPGANVAFRLLLKTAKGPLPTIDDWRNVFRPSAFSFKESWIFFVVFIPVVLLSVGGIGLIFVSDAARWIKILSASTVGLNLLFLRHLVYDMFEVLPKEWVLFAFVWPIGAIEVSRKEDQAGDPLAIRVVGPVFNLTFSAWLPIVAYFTFDRFSLFGPWYLIVIFWLVFSGISTSLWLYAARLHRRAQNVLHGMVEPLSISSQERLDQTRRSTQVLSRFLRRSSTS